MNRIKELRLANGWLQAELAEKLSTGKNTVSRYETEQRQLDPATIHKLCDIFDVTADYLLGRSDVAQPALSDEEAQLVAAFRQADEDAKDMVRLALKRWAAAKPIEDKDAAS